MPQLHRSSTWLKILIPLVSIGLLVELFMTLFSSGELQSYLRSFPFSSSTPTPIIVGIDQLSRMRPSLTPLQPEPTNTFTPTPTFTLTATSTPTRTPRPTKTPGPVVIIPTIDQSSGDIPESAYISGIAGYNQSHSLSCEARSAVDWAGYFGVTISENTFQSNLPSSDDPDSGFVGDPDGTEGQLPPNSYGVHARPVADLLNDYGLSAKPVHGYSYDDVRRQVAAGQPVIVWVYGNVWSGGVPVSYTASSGHTTTVVAFEHTVIVIGYDSSYVYFLDGGIKYTRDIWIFKNSWSALGNMAVIMQ